MVLQNAKVKRELFTLEELTRLDKVILEGEYSKIMNVLDDITPEKEIEMQRLINYLMPLQDGFESEVRKEMEKALPNGPQTPEEEALWEQRLQTEFKEYAKKQEARNNILIGETTEEVVEEVIKEDSSEDEEEEDDEDIEVEEETAEEIAAREARKLQKIENLKKAREAKKAK